MANIDISKLTLEQKVVYRLAELGFITSAGEIQRALNDVQFANFMISPINDDGSLYPEVDLDNDGVPDENPSINDIMQNTPGIPPCDGDCEAECNHEALTNDEIQEVFDNDNK